MTLKHNSDAFIAPLLPDQKEYPRGLYNDYPAFEPQGIQISSGYAELGHKIISGVKNGWRVLVIDGYHGVNWDNFKINISRLLDLQKIGYRWFNMADCMARASELEKKIEPFLGGDDPVFGTHFPLGIETFFDAAKIAALRIEAAKARGKSGGELTIIYGSGAGLLELWDQLWYIDIAKNVVQGLAKEKLITNLGLAKKLTFEQFYKRSYFVDWPAMNRLKRQLLPQLDLFIDLNDPDKPASTAGDDFRSSLNQISKIPFRVRPWFLPGPWGGKYTQGHMGQDANQPNMAWSYELIVPENGLVFKHEDKYLECSFDCLMFQENRQVLGKEAARQFIYEWPIRLDYLDTIDGGNLSVQCHPRPDYIRDHFGETYTQDETYYICNSKPEARVYLGLTENCDPHEFRRELEESQRSGKEVDIDKFVNSEPAKPHDLFMIPNGTVHCSGRGNLVLEISATPYIFTFKLYDYLRRDLNGNLRPINIAHGFKNIHFDRRKNWVQKNLIARPELVESGTGWEKYVLYDSPLTFYNIYRVHFDQEYIFDTQDHAFAVNLVEGRKITLRTRAGKTASLAYLESMIIPAAAQKITVTNESEMPCKLVMVQIRPGTGKTLPLNR